MRTVNEMAGDDRPQRPVGDSPIAGTQRPSFRWSDIWKAPLHDLPIRDEIIYQHLPLSSEMGVLEIGPGSGFTAFRLARRVRRLTLVDVAQGTITHLAAALKEIRNINLICADVCAPGLAGVVEAKYDAIYALAVFDLLPDPETCLRNLSEVLRSGGHLLLQFPNYPPPKSPGVTYFRTRKELDRLLKVSGFEQWVLYALKLRPHADFIFREFHERPLQFYRRLRNQNMHEKPLTYDQSWAFDNKKGIERYRVPLHAAWMALFAGLRLGGDCFESTLLGEEILNRNLLLQARR